MTTLTEGKHTAEHLLWEAGEISREEVVIAAAAPAMVAGTVLGKITASGKYAPYADANVDGTGTAVAVLYHNVPDSAADQKAVVHIRLAEVSRVKLVGLDANGEADLKASNIIVRG